ncbi:pyocin activator PrtN family protein [Pseudomonas sp. WHRI 8822A]|uniref:pyocin activator PrtN family protein n=1 Tax=unclassified Pseudomonas TaxID=196821 RepID=UPI0017851310|nr:pyocin activator PrtN family protein [Pseudomonas sp. PDM12]MBD9657507.1 pyocin activator PrtN family protein [Pseudomonas sp. PDM12]
MSQQALCAKQGPRTQTVEMLFRTFGDVLAPVQLVRDRYFRNLNVDNFTRALNTGRLGLPVVTLDSSAKAPKFIDIRHLAIFIDSQADVAGTGMAEQSLERPSAAP